MFTEIALILGIIIGVLFMIYIVPELTDCWELKENPGNVLNCASSVDSLIDTGKTIAGDIQNDIRP